METCAPAGATSTHQDPAWTDLLSFAAKPTWDTWDGQVLPYAGWKDGFLCPNNPNKLGKSHWHRAYARVPEESRVKTRRESTQETVSLSPTQGKKNKNW